MQFQDDIPLDLARAAHRGTSFTPELRGDQERDAYAAQLLHDYNALAESARRGPTPEKSLEVLQAEFERYRQGYRKHWVIHLARRGRCVSTMITGGSSFNVNRAQKANHAEQRAGERLAQFRLRALNAIKKAIRPDLAPIMSCDANATDRLKEKLAKMEADRALMKAANAAIRKHAKAGPEAQVAAVVALGRITESSARALLVPDFCGRIGFADYKLTNLGAEIRRTKARIGAVTTAQATPAETVHGAAAARLEDVPAENRVRLFFPGKPAVDVRDRLKGAGFRWTPTLGCWQAYRNHHSLVTARSEAGVPQ